MLYPDIDNKFYILMSKAVKAAAKEKGYEVISYYCDANDPADAIVGMNVLSEVTRRVLFMCSHKDYGDYFRRYRIPLVAIGASGEDGYFDGVQLDGFGAGRIVAQKLMSEKCDKFLMVSPEMNDEENTRKSGFKYELERMNEQIGDENFISFSTDAELKVKFLKKADEFIKEGRLGVFCYHDLVLKSILDICQAHGRNILEKSYVIGFDNLPIFDNAGVYSSVAYSFKDMAKKSVGLLISRINGDYNDAQNAVFDLTALGVEKIESAKITVRTIKNLKNQNSYTDIYGKSTVLNNFNTLTKSALKTDKSAKIIITNIDGTDFTPVGGNRETILTKDGAYIRASATSDDCLLGAVKRQPQPSETPDGYVVYDNYPLLTRLKRATVYIPESPDGVDAENYFYNSADEYFEVSDGSFASNSAILSSVSGSAEYSGVGFKLNNGVKISYKGKVNLAGKTADDKLIELFISPEENKSGGEEFASIKIKFYDLNDGGNCINLLISQANDKQFTKMTAYASWYDESNGKTVTQNALGYFLAIGKYSVDFPSQATQSLYGKPVGSNGYLPITFYYDNSTKRLYATPVADKNNSKTKGLIRDFSLNETQMLIRESKVDCVDGVWQGFSGDEVGVEISVQTVGGKVGNLSVLSLGGVDFGAPHTITPIVTGVKDLYYPLPTIGDCYDPSARDCVAVEDVSLVRRVFFVADGKEYKVEDGKFLPDKAGDYRCEYYAAIGGKTYRTDTVIRVDDASKAPALNLNVSEYKRI